MVGKALVREGHVKGDLVLGVLVTDDLAQKVLVIRDEVDDRRT